MKKATLQIYLIGFISSIALTLVAYDIVVTGFLAGNQLLFAILGLAVAQLIVQLIFFLHLNSESGPRWKLVAFMSTIGLVFIVVVGSIWIMNHLNNNMTPEQVNQYLQDSQGGF